VILVGLVLLMLPRMLSLAPQAGALKGLWILGLLVLLVGLAMLGFDFKQRAGATAERQLLPDVNLSETRSPYPTYAPDGSVPPTIPIGKAAAREKLSETLPAASGSPEDGWVPSTMPIAKPGIPGDRDWNLPPETRPTEWSEAVFEVIEWRRFELLVETLFKQAGFQTKAQSHGENGGADVWLYSRHVPGEPVSVVQCKHWQNKKVGLDKMRELAELMAAHNVRRGQFATTSAFTDDARAFCRDNGINLLDVSALLSLISKRSPEHQKEALGIALDGEYWRPTCVNCGFKLTARRPRGGGAQFWGCTHCPDSKPKTQGRGAA
jgi:restriction system protein